ncbi:hypothetical protein HDU92_001188 [Lobulomyces angularis]|nr:hypothetical protein HDU92_001188 [Lobulomyces angularis]
MKDLLEKFTRKFSNEIGIFLKQPKTSRILFNEIFDIKPTDKILKNITKENFKSYQGGAKQLSQREHNVQQYVAKFGTPSLHKSSKKTYRNFGKGLNFMQIGTASPKTRQLSRVEYDTPFPAVTLDEYQPNFPYIDQFPFDFTDKPGVIALEKVKGLFKNHKKLLDELEKQKKATNCIKNFKSISIQHSFPKQTPFSVNITESVKEFSNDLSILRQQQMMEE